MTEADTRHENAAHKTVTVTVDEEPVSGVSQHTTPNAILSLAGIDQATHYLVRINGRHRESFKDEGDKDITVHEREKFVSVFTGPTPTS
ncbi:hypothetical protein BN159_4449 [Streptomyces davaonensis JCM 4913]|uniref:Multi-ubiquitin domain-containing protein n=1 Tax=Streptomyces davaonensis (strain DSM 101723 / JCM 4913 / KCC S-0913 / 768) TaxID=1214101 RepID=K4R683_STRDJ|nr:hypothetical protein [Streptomyces davaonensis]CCK28828.1 hypothetical protein BN159_4449 [Streptomyces davaonensis JCM 4913]